MTQEIRVPFFSDRAINDSEEILHEISQVLDSRQLILGAKVKEFEDNFAKYLGANYCVSLANGTDAIEIALRALGVNSGDNVATVANAGFYTSTALHQIGAKPIYLEIDPNTFLISVDDFKVKMQTERIKAVVVTHLYGLPANIKEIVDIAKSKNISIIEDCAQAHGLKIANQFAGTFGDISTFSFYPTKNLGAIGDGGAIVTNNESLALLAKSLRQYGWQEKYHVDINYGRNSRLDEIQAAILNKKLTSLQKNNDLRLRATRKYFESLNDLPIKFSSFVLSGVSHLLPIVVNERQQLRAFLDQAGIQTAIHYPIPDHKQSAYPNTVNLPVTEKFCDSVISLPIFPGISEEELDYVCLNIRAFYENR